MAADIKKNDDFSKGPISKTILRLAVPMVLAQFVNVLYNIVDRMYIGHISDTSVDALTGVGVTFPILLMVTAFANLFGTGGTPLFSMARGAAQRGGEEGEKQRERAADVMNNTFSMLVITGVICALWCCSSKSRYCISSARATRRTLMRTATFQFTCSAAYS